MEKLKLFFEESAFGVCSKLGEKLNFPIDSIRLFFIYTKDNFYNIRESKLEENDLYYRQSVYTNEVTPAHKNNDILTKTDLQNLFENLLSTIYSN